MGYQKNAPSQLRTKLARISKTADAVLQERARSNNTSVADEVDKLLGLQAEKQLDFTVLPNDGGYPQLRILPPSPSVGIDGNKRYAFGVKSKGGVIHE